MNRTMTVADNFETIVVATRKKLSKSFRNKTVSEENLLTCWCFCLMLTAKVQRKPFMIGHSDSLCKDVFSPILVDLEQTSVKLTWLTVCVILTWSIVVLFVTWSIVFAFHFTATVANYHKVASSQIQRSTVISSVQMKTYPQRMKPYPRNIPFLSSSIPIRRHWRAAPSKPLRSSAWPILTYTPEASSIWSTRAFCSSVLPRPTAVSSLSLSDRNPPVA